MNDLFSFLTFPIFCKSSTINIPTSLVIRKLNFKKTKTFSLKEGGVSCLLHFSTLFVFYFILLFPLFLMQKEILTTGMTNHTSRIKSKLKFPIFPMTKPGVKQVTKTSAHIFLQVDDGVA